MARTVSKDLARRIARELLISFHELHLLRDADVDALQPIYDFDGRTVVYYEVKFTSQLLPHNGYAIISATEDDLPVVEFSEKGETYFERFNSLLKKPFRMVWFGPVFMAAESIDGKLLASIGEMPGIIPNEATARARDEESDHRQPTREKIEPSMEKHIVAAAETLEYHILKSKFKRRRPPAAQLKRLWQIAKSPQSPCLNNYYGVMRPDVFERGRTDSFEIQATDLGEMTRLRIRHDNSGSRPGWFLEDIRIRHEGTGSEWLFPCHRWLARDEDDGRIDRMLVSG